MLGTSRNENEASHTGSPRCFDQPKSADHVLLDELDQVALGTTKSGAWSVELWDGDTLVPEIRQPFDMIADVAQSVATEKTAGMTSDGLF